MLRRTRLVAAFAFGAGLTAAGVVLAQTQTGSPASPEALAQPSPPPAQSSPPLVQSPPLLVQSEKLKSWSPDTSLPTYSVKPPDGSSGIYLPAVVLGYAKSVAGCFVIGCDDGPQVDGSSGASSSGSAEPPAKKVFDRR